MAKNGQSLLNLDNKCRHCGKDIDPQCHHAFSCSNRFVKGARTAQSSSVKHAVKRGVDSLSLENTVGGAVTVINEPMCKNHLRPKNTNPNAPIMPASQATSWRLGADGGKRADLGLTFNQGAIRGERKILCDASGVHPTRDKCDPARMVIESGVAATTREGAKVDEYKPWYHVEKGQLVGLGFEVFGALGNGFMKITNLLAKAICHNPTANSVYKRFGSIPVTAPSQATYLLRQQIFMAIFRGNADLMERFITHCFPVAQRLGRVVSVEFE